MGKIMTKIYLVENIEPGTNKVYIGKTKNSRERAHKHFYGNQIKYSYIDEIDSLCRKDWESLESYWIEQFRQWGFSIVNHNKKGGGGPEFHTEEVKNKIRQNRIGIKHTNHSKMPEWYGEFISNINKGRISPNKGKTKSEEAKCLISEKLKGRMSPNTRPIIQYNRENQVIREWISISEAGRELGISLGNITSVCKKQSKTAGGYIWKFRQN
jgi:hypothetical protein